MNKNITLLFGVALTMLSIACKKDGPEDPVIPNEEEVITSLNFTLTPEAGGTPVVLSFQDLDGNGGNAPIITGGTLDANATYSGSLVLLNELEDPAINITKEIAEEAEEHQFFFQSTVSGLSIAYDDADANGNPIGLSTTVRTTGQSTGAITVVLRHGPDKNATAVSAGDITNAGGETDIEVTFNVDVQ